MSSAAEQDGEVWNELPRILAGGPSAPRRNRAWSSQEKCGRVISSRRENPHRLEAFLSHKYIDISAGRCGWKGRAHNRPDASNRGVDERMLLCYADGPGTIHQQAGDQGNERIG